MIRHMDKAAADQATFYLLQAIEEIRKTARVPGPLYGTVRVPVQGEGEPEEEPEKEPVRHIWVNAQLSFDEEHTADAEAAADCVRRTVEALCGFALDKDPNLETKVLIVKGY